MTVFPPPSARIASEALLSFLRCVKLAELAEVVTSHSEPLEDLNRYSDFVIQLARYAPPRRFTPTYGGCSVMG